MGHWLVDTAGVGSLIAVGLALSILAAYTRMLVWIHGAPSAAPRTAPAERSAGVEQVASAEDEPK